jgi:heat shock protein HslJ
VGARLTVLGLAWLGLVAMADPGPGARQPTGPKLSQVHSIAGEYGLVELNGRRIVAEAAQPAPTPPGVPEVRPAPQTKPPRGARLVASLPTLIFSEDGRVSGSTGCNRLATSINPSARPDRPVFTPIAATKMACLAEGAMQVEADYLRALTRATRMDMGGGQIRLFARNGSRLAVFQSISARAPAPPPRYTDRTGTILSPRGLAD